MPCPTRATPNRDLRGGSGQPQSRSARAPGCETPRRRAIVSSPAHRSASFSRPSIASETAHDVQAPVPLGRLVVFTRFGHIAAQIIDHCRGRFHCVCPSIQSGGASIILGDLKLGSCERFPRRRVLRVRFDDPPAQFNDRRFVCFLLRRCELLVKPQNISSWHFAANRRRSKTPREPECEPTQKFADPALG